ncbi:MAG TPA: class I SAM-dependent methyltransferase [bacterium]|nr:class I SAM-dependent methyltransferase [bacterium]
MASEWDKHRSSKKFNNDLMSVLARYFVNCDERYFGFSGTEIVLDFGAGPGDVSFLIKDKVRRIYLFDKSKYFVEKLRKRKSLGKF